MRLTIIRVLIVIHVYCICLNRYPCILAGLRVISKIKTARPEKNRGAIQFKSRMGFLRRGGQDGKNTRSPITLPGRPHSPLVCTTRRMGVFLFRSERRVRNDISKHFRATRAARAATLRGSFSVLLPYFF